MVDQAGAIAMLAPESIMFSSTDATWVVLHKTAGFNTPEECAEYFQNPAKSGGVSSHYIVGLDGRIVQCVPENRGAGANCCTKGSYASYLPYCDGQSDNMNWHSISVEHIDPKTDNSTPMPVAQKNASFKLVRDICKRHNIPMRSGDRSGGVIGHRDIDPINRSRCPGNYPWDELFAYLKGDGEQDMAIDLNNAWIKAHFDIESPTQIRPKNGGPSLGGDELEYWLATGAAARMPLTAVHTITVNGKKVGIRGYESGWYAIDPDHALDNPSMPGGNSKFYMVKISDLPKLGINIGAPGPVVEKIPATVLDDIQLISSAFGKLKRDAGIS